MSPSVPVPALPRRSPSLLSTLNLHAAAGTASCPRLKRPEVPATRRHPGQARDRPGLLHGTQSGKGTPSSG